MSSTKKCKKLHIRPDEADEALGHIIRSQTIKAVANAAGRTLEAVKKWRGTGLPDAWLALVNLMRNDDEIFTAVLALADRAPPAALGIRQRQALADALRILEGAE